MAIVRNLFNILAQVFRSIGANKLRSFLTMFGIAWGVACCCCWLAWVRGFVQGSAEGWPSLART